MASLSHCDLDPLIQAAQSEPTAACQAIDFAASLNAEQYAAVTAPPGPALVLAGAGSGKTRTLTYRVAYLLSQGVKPWQILLLTFTNKSAREMLERVEALTQIPTHHFWGGTFHHIGQKLLRMHGESIGLEKNFTLLDEGDAENLLSDVMRQRDPTFTRNKDNPKASAIESILSFTRNKRQPLAQTVHEKYPHWEHLIGDFEQFYKDYTARKRQRQLVDYDDLLERWLELLENCPEVRNTYQKRFSHILVDEYQDTNPLQSALIDCLAQQHHQVMAVGDDAQCIYTWRGASFENIMTFPQRHPGTIIYKIQTNYRSTPNILDFANGVLDQQHVGYEKRLAASRPSKCSPYFVPVADTNDQSRFILRRMQGLLQEGFALSDIAILYRAHYQAMELQMELSRLNVPYQITSGIRFFEQAHVRDFVAQLRFVANPNDVMAFYRFSSLLPKIGGKTAERILQTAQAHAEAQAVSLYAALGTEGVLAKVPDVARESWTSLCDTLLEMAQAAKRQEAPEAIIQIGIQGWYGDFLRTLYPNWTSRRDDLDSLVQFAGKHNDLADLLTQLTLLSSETHGRGAESSVDSLRLSTVHQAKGLEFRVVFVLGLSENLFPIKRAVEEGNIDEELRLFYVAVTRAQDELYLIHPRVTYQGNFPTLLKPSRFVADLPQHLYELVQLPSAKDAAARATRSASFGRS